MPLFNLSITEGEKMIGTIKLSYKHDATVSTAVVSAFFKTAGIHVIENYYDEPFSLQEELLELKIKPIPNTEIPVAIGAEIILVDGLDDEQSNKYIDIFS